MKSKLTGLQIAILLLLVFSGCSGSGSPLTPEVSGRTQAYFSGPSVWGYYQCSLSPDGTRFEINQLRTAMFTANVNNLLESKPGNLIISDIDATNYFAEGRLDCTVTLRHPFAGLDVYHGFDVRGVFMHNGSASLNYDGLVYSDGTGVDEAALLNPDGYTRWFNFTEFNGGSIPLLEYYPGKLSSIPGPTAVLNPYKIFADGLGAEDDYYLWISDEANAADRGIIRAGQADSRRYQLKFPFEGGSPVAEFQYAVIATWEPGDPTLTGLPSEYDPMDFPSSANCEEAFFIHPSTDQSSLYYVDGNNLGGTFKANVEIFDWQGGPTGGNGVQNEIERLIIEADFIPGGTVEWSQSELASVATNGTLNSSVFQIDIPGCAPVDSGPTGFWAIVEASGLYGESYGQGFPSEYPASARRAAFTMGQVDVSDQDLGGLSVTSISPDTVPFWGSVTGATVSGTGFEAGATVELRKGTEPVIPADNVVFVNGNTITCGFDLTARDSGDWDVVVINPSSSEGVLPGGFTIEVWSDEMTLDTGGNRLPQMCETTLGSAVLLFGCNDNNMRYIPFQEGVGWQPVDIAVSGDGGHWLLQMNPDPVTSDVYLGSHLSTYRYTGNAGLWDYCGTGWSSARACAVTADINGKICLFDNSESASGWIIYSRRFSWCGGIDLYYSYFMDNYNTDLYSEANIIDQDTAGTMYFAYERDYNHSPYEPATDPRWVKLARVPLDTYSPIYSLTEIDIANNLDPLDSPSVSVDSNDDIHYAYRKWIDATSQWQVVYKFSNDSGVNFGSESHPYEGALEPEDGYVYVMVDSNDVIHCVYNIEGEIEYRQSSDGATWSTMEIVNESASGGSEDITPRMLVTSDGIMHVAWIRDSSGGTGYGDVYHRMRDLY